MTQAHMATFVWRYSGSPEPTSLDSPFIDVVAGSFYEKAVAWLIEQGITTGATLTTFSPDDPVTRVIRPGFPGGSRPLNEDESYEYECGIEADDAAVFA